MKMAALAVAAFPIAVGAVVLMSCQKDAELDAAEEMKHPGGPETANAAAPAAEPRAPQTSSPGGPPPTARSEPRDSSVPIEKLLLARALTDRTEPDIGLSKPPIKRVGRCAVEIGSRPRAEAERVRAAFRTRNPGEWRLSVEAGDEGDSFRGTLRTAFHSGGGGSAAAIEEVGEQKALEQVARFLARNHDLFGIERDNLLGAEWSAERGPSSTAAPRAYHLRGERPQPGFESYRDMNRRWKMNITLGPGGSVVFAHGLTNALPPVLLCDRPKLEASDRRVTARVVGHVLSFSGFSGKRVSAGTVTAGDIVSIELTAIRIDADDRRSAVVRLVYAVAVNRPPMPSPGWRFLVDVQHGRADHGPAALRHLR